MPQPLPYGSVRDMYATLRDAGITTKSLPDWSVEQNALTNTNEYDAGVHDNLAHKADYWLSKAIEATQIPRLTQETVGSAGRALGVSPETQEKFEGVGHGLARGIVNFAPLLAGPETAVGRLPSLLKLAGVGGLSGLETYGQTDSTAAGIVGGVTAAAMPGVAGLAEQEFLKRAGGKLLEGPLADATGAVTDNLKQYFPQTITQGVGSQIAGQAAAAGLGEVGKVATSVMDPNQEYHFDPVDTLLGLTVGQLPFAGIHAYQHGAAGFGGKATSERVASIEDALAMSKQNIDLKSMRDKLAERAPIENVPLVPQDVKTPEDAKLFGENQTLLSKLRGEQVRVKDDPTLTEDQKVEKLNALLQDESAINRTTVTAQSVFGDSIAPEGDRQQVVGREVRSNLRSRTIFVDDKPVNPPELRGKYVSYSTAYEPNPTKRSDETTVYGLPDSQWQTVKSAEEWNSRFPKNADGTPELPTQDQPASDADLRAHIADLSKVEEQADNAKTVGDLQQAVVRMNNVKLQAGMNPTTDSVMGKISKMLLETGMVNPEDVPYLTVKVEAKRTKKNLQAVQDTLARKQEQLRSTGDLSTVATEKGVIENFGTHNGEPVVRLPRADQETTAIHDILDEHLTGVQAQKDGEDSFAKWMSTHPEDQTSLPLERERYKHYWTLRAQGDIEPGETLKGQDLKTFYAALKSDGIAPDKAESLADFPERDHVLNWDDSIAQVIKNVKAPQISPKVEAGKGWLFSIGSYDPETRILNEKHTLPKTGDLREAQFRNMAGVGKPLTEAEMGLYHAIVPEAFDGQGNVNVPKLWKGLKEKGPVVETRVLGDVKRNTPEGITDANETELVNKQLQTEHLLDTLAPNWRNVTRMRDVGVNGIPHYIVEPDTTLPEGVQTLLDQYNNLQNERARNDPNLGTNDGWTRINTGHNDSRYSFLGPKPESQMPGYVEGLVRLPESAPKLEKYTGRQIGDTAQYRGPHFGSEDTNVLAFYRGYEETLPDGEKAFHVIEVQSDWGQARRKNVPDEEASHYQRGMGLSVQDHPLLKVYETLALKAAIQHAKEIGATKVILSDAETAMMTEGHDAQSRVLADAEKTEFFNKASAENVANNQGSGIKGEVYQDGNIWRVKFPLEPTQSKGMRLHYDQTLPSAMEKLTGEKGESVGLGQHKNVVSDLDYQQSVQNQIPLQQIGSPVFKDEQGNPKTQITGRVYDISKLPSEFTLTDRTRAPQKPFVPNLDQMFKIEQMGLHDGGEGIRRFLSTSPDPFYKALAADLEKFGPSLARVTAEMQNTPRGASFAELPKNRQTNLVFSHGLLEANRASIDYVFAHELIHGLTRNELNNPTNAKFIPMFDEIRQKLIDALPAKDRKVYDWAIASDWLEKYSNDETGWASLQDRTTPERALVLYGLLHNEELVSQGLTEPAMRTYMQSVKSDKQDWFSRFTNTVKRLLQIGDHVPDSVFNEFLSKTDQLMQQSSNVADFTSFTDRFYERMGLPEQQVNDQTRRALGVVINGGDRDSMLANLQATTVVRPDVLRTRSALDKVFQEKSGPDFDAMSGVLSELGHDVGLKGVDDYVYDMMTGVGDKRSLDLLPDVALQHIYAQAADMQQVLSSIEAASATKNRGLVNLRDPDSLRQTTKAGLRVINRLLDHRTMLAAAVKDIQAMLAIKPDSFMDSMLADPRRAPDVLKEDQPKDKVGNLNWFFKQPAQWARSNPVTGELIDRGYELQKNAREMFGNIVKVMGMDVDSGASLLSKKGLDSSTKAIENPKVLAAIDKWMWANNKVAMDNKEGVTMLGDNHPLVAEALSKLTPPERASAVDVVAKAGIMTQKMHQEVLNKMEQIAAVRGGKILLRAGVAKSTDALTLADTLFKALNVDQTDPQAMAIAQGQIQQVQQRTSLEGFNTLLKFNQAELEKYNTWKDFFLKNPFWASGQRQEQWLVEYRRGQKLVLDQGSSKKEVLARAKGAVITKEPWDQWAKRGDDQFPHLGPDTDAIFSKLQELEDRQLSALKAQGMSQEDEDTFRALSPATQFAREGAVNQVGVPQFATPARGLTKGADELPWLWNHIAWNRRATTYWTRNLFRAQADLHLNDPEIVAQPDFQKLLQQHVDNMLQPDPNAIRQINKFTTVWNMGLAPASALVNGFQTITTLVPELTRITGKPVESYARWGRAISEVIGNGVQRKGWLGQEHTDFMHDAAVAGERSFSMWDDNAATDETIATNWKRVMMKNKPQTLGQRLSDVNGMATNVALWLFKNVEKFNNDVSLIAAFDTYREKGLDYEQAKTEAFRLNRAVNYGGGRANRPVGIYSGEGPVLRSAAMLGTNLQNYNLGVVGQLVRYLQDGAFRPNSLKPSEVWAARKAGTQMLGTQFALAGALGLPFVSGILAVLQQLGVEANKDVRETVHTLLDGDEANGNLLGDVALTGLPSMLGWDMQSRLSIGNTLPGVSEYNGFQPEALAGPPLSTAWNFANGLLRVAQGDPKGGWSFVPPGVRKILQLASNNGQLLDHKDRPLLTPTPGERVGLALGFQPKRLSDLNTASRLAELQTTNLNRQSQQFHSQLAEEAMKGNFGTIRQTLLARAQSDKTYDPVSGVRSIARLAEDLTFPRDLRREGTRNQSTEREKLLNTFSLGSTPEPSEVQRVQFRQQLQSRLGLMTRDHQELRSAELLDELRQQHPTATRAQLSMLAQSLLRRSAGPRLQEPQE